MTHEEFRRELKRSPEQAHRTLFETYCNYVYTIVYNRLRSCASREDIEECVCSVFADVFVSYDPEKDVSGDISGFIGTVARRRAAALYRRSCAREPDLPLDDEALQLPDYAQDIEKISDDGERRKVLLDTIAELGEPDATIIMQKFYYGRSARDIAGMLSLTPENIRVRCSRAVKKLKGMLEKSDISI